MKPLALGFVMLTGALLFTGCASTKPTISDPNEARAHFETARSNFNTTKVRALNEVMKLTVAEANKFWPIYRDYERDLAIVGDRKLKLISDYLTYHKAGSLNDQNSKELAARWLQNTQDRLDLWKKYYQQINDEVSPIRATQFLQVETLMANYVDLNVASELPVVGDQRKGH